MSTKSGSPFYALTEDLIKLGWSQEVVEHDGVKELKIMLPKQQAFVPTLSLETSESATNTKVVLRIITQEEISTGSFYVPLDSWNLDNFQPLVYQSGHFKGTFLNIVEDMFKQLSNRNSSTILMRNKVCFSKLSKVIIILPSQKEDLYE